eukprot:764713-Hanusia_phi.AAC.2
MNVMAGVSIRIYSCTCKTNGRGNMELLVFEQGLIQMEMVEETACSVTPSCRAWSTRFREDSPANQQSSCNVGNNNIWRSGEFTEEAPGSAASTRVSASLIPTCIQDDASLCRLLQR